MSNGIITVFDDIGAWFKKIFTKVQPWEVTALSALNTVAPEAELLLAFIDPVAAEIATPIITEVQADLGTVASLLKNQNTVNLGTFLTAIKNNLTTLLSAGHITNPASVQKATGIVGAIIGVVDSIAAQLAAATPAPTPVPETAAA
jgi:hypothetical protein